jgi:hypothetical protein
METAQCGADTIAREWPEHLSDQSVREHTVSFAGFVAHIQNLDGANVFFGGGEDRATGDFDRVTVSGNVGKSYELFCKAVTPSKSQKTK